MKPNSKALIWTKCKGSVKQQAKYKPVPLTTHQQYEAGVMVELIADDVPLSDKALAVESYIATLENPSILSMYERSKSDQIDFETYINVKHHRGVAVIRFANSYVNDSVLNDPRMILSLNRVALVGEITFVVIQPNYENSVQFVSKDVVEREINYLKHRASHLTNELTVNKLCKFCLHYQRCEAVVTKNKGELMENEQAILKIHDAPETLSEQDIANILDVEKTFIDGFTRVKVEATRRILEENKVINGWYLGSGRSSSTWNAEPEEVAKQLKSFRIPKDEVYISKLISPSKALKLAKLSDRQLEKLKELVSTTAGKDQLKQGSLEPEFPSFL